MIAVGVTYADSAVTAPVRHLLCGDLAVLFVDGATTARDRMAACLRCCERLRSFLPLLPRNAVPLHAAAKWIRSHKNHAIEELDRLNGMSQLTIKCQTLTKPGASLRSRAAARREAVDLAERMAQRLMPRQIVQTYQSGCLTLHAMLQRSGAEQWPSRLASLDLDPQLDVICVGPWPPFSFFAGPS